MRYAAVGDSFTEGLGDELPDGSQRGWADLVAAGLPDPDVRYANFAVRGRLLRPIVEEQIEAALALDPAPTVMTFNGGGNDMMRPGTDLAGLLALIERGIRRCVEAGVRLVVVAGPNPSQRLPFGGSIDRKGEILTVETQKLAAGHGVEFADVFHDLEIRKAPYWSPDRLHLNAAGHRRAAGLVLTAMGYASAAHVVDPGPAESRRILDEARYYREHVLPWVQRRLRGRSSGDDRTGKYLAWTAVKAG
ncbi:SGNH/GDSL hydrolase family protein [Actinoplanes sp. N902-109]|uniref:SGNH/GDSL hydrolase family protein n=1 Tax=Actinoplanes sp. (strain N902-109) TaxID=649831 RepID=UPI0003293924|nr:SGNH/GDSL hydrolase family protein [Actinoplanes sp. N902-109]AGL18916.1 G-D-S-L family lipolytic protein [Actinoplanes sp. N902-109]